MKTLIQCTLIMLASFAGMETSSAQGTAFTYQGRLTQNGVPANITNDLRFTLYAAASGGAAVGTSNVFNNLVISNGLFAVTLDFGAGVFPGADRWLEIGVRTGGSGSFTTLSPRQKLTPAPYAIYSSDAATAATALTAGNLSGTLPASQLTGTVPLSKLPASILTNNASGINLTGSFTGNGGSLTNVSAATLGGLDASSFWKTSGNSGTTPGVNFFGTTDGQPIELRVNGARALRLEPNAASPNVIGGYGSNSVSPGVIGATIAGGGRDGLVHTVTANHGTIGGGDRNTVNGTDGTVAGGGGNVESGDYSFIGGGLFNTIQNNAPLGTIGGGEANIISGTAGHAMIGGGYANVAGGAFSSISGGTQNTIASNGYSAVIGGGVANQIRGVTGATLAGGWNNLITNWWATIGGGFQNTGGGQESTIAGGSFNLTLGQGDSILGGYGHMTSNSFATVAGGDQNAAMGNSSFAAGHHAKARHDGSFVWGDSLEEDISSTASNQFVVRASGGVRFVGSNGSILETIDGSGRLALSGGISGAGAAPLEFFVNNLRALRLEPDASGQGAPNIIEGSPGNFVTNDVVGATIGGGGATNYFGSRLTNSVTGNWGTVSGGAQNTAGTFGTVAGGHNNTASSSATVSGGSQNTASGGYAIVGSGEFNRASGNYAMVSGGYQNIASADYAVVAGGYNNTVSGYAAAVSGGNNNTAGGISATVGGGTGNINSGFGSGIVSGFGNHIGVQADGSAIGGGGANLIVGSENLSVYSIIGGGQGNSILTNGVFATIAGGLSNTIRASSSSVISGGQANNISSAQNGVIGGGGDNQIVTNADDATIGGGEFNDIGSFAMRSTIGGGFANTIAESFYGTIAGGELNHITGPAGGTIGGGLQNSINSQHGTIAGGRLNDIGANSDAGVIGGGNNNRIPDISAYATIPGGDNNFATNRAFAAGTRAKAKHSGAFVWGDSTTADFASTASNQFLVRASGGVGINTNDPFGAALNVNGTVRATAFTGDGSGLNSLNAGNISGGSVPDARLSANVALLTGNQTFTGTKTFNSEVAATRGVRINNTNLWFRGDNNHGLGWYGSGRPFAGNSAIDGPVLFGFSGGALGTEQFGSEKVALLWNANGNVGIGTSPGARLHVAETVSTVALFDSASTGGTWLGLGNTSASGQRWSLISTAAGNGEGPGKLLFFTSQDNSKKMMLDGAGNLTITGTYSPSSDRNVKAGFAPVDSKSILEKVAALPITRWHYTNDAATPHIGAVAQDFYSAFNVGADDKHIATVDADGVALAAIQGLNEVVKEKEARIATLEKSVTELKELVAKLVERR